VIHTALKVTEMIQNTRQLAYILGSSYLYGIALAADCFQERKKGDPSGIQIADAITKNDALSNICNGSFSPSSQTDNTWNYW
jgi:hypothetical protein